MRLTSKTALIIAAALAIATVANMILLQVFVQPTFHELDRVHAEEDHKRVRDAIATDLKAVSDKTQDWSHWDDLYNFGAGAYPDFPKENLQASHIVNMAMATGLLLGKDFKVLYQVNADLATGNALAPLVADPHLPVGLRARFADGEFVGKPAVVELNGAMHLAAIAPIVKSDGSGPPSGYIVFAKPVDAAYVAGLADRLKVDVKLTPPKPGRNETPAETIDALFKESAWSDHAGVRAMKIVTRTPRDVTSLGTTVLLWTSCGLALIGILAAIGGAVMMNRMVISPVARIADHMARIAKSADLTQKLQEDRKDEIGALARQLNSMAAELDEARKTLIDQTYASGMSEMAADVLHNVRNAMNPIAVRIWTLQKLMGEQISDNFRRAVVELAGEALNVERRRKLGAYALATVDEIVDHRQKMGREFSDVVACGRHIDDVLRDFDQVSLGPRTVEAVSLRDIVDAARLTASGTKQATKLVLAQSLDAMPSVQGNRVILQQVMGNLLKNAEEAIAKVRPEGGSIVVSAAHAEQDGAAFVEISVADDGIGIEPERQAAIFARGHSTNGAGNRGLGLHWCANSLKSMGGAIGVSSAGAGQGSTFTIRLPVHKKLQDAAA